MKKYLFFIIIFLGGCAWWKEPISDSCPNITIPYDNSYFVQHANYKDDFQIELIGYKRYCTAAQTINRRYAIIKPIFRVTRLSDGDESRVDFAFYTQTLQGPPEYLGKRSYFAYADIPLGVKEVVVDGHPAKVRIPCCSPDFSINLGLSASVAELDYNKSNNRYIKPKPQELNTCSLGKRIKTEKTKEPTSGCGCNL